MNAELDPHESLGPTDAQIARMRARVRATIAADQTRTRRRRGWTIGGTLGLLVLVAGGTSAAMAAGVLQAPAWFVAAPAPAPTATHEPEAVSTPAPTPASPAPTITPSIPAPTIDPADTASWVLDAKGMGPIRLGQTADEVAPSLAALYAPDATGASCPATFFRPLRNGTEPGILVVSAPGEGVTVIMIGGDALAASRTPQLIAESPRTAKGVVIGTTFDDLEAAYPGIGMTGRVVQGGASEYHVQLDANAYLIFEVRDSDHTVDDIAVSTAAQLPAEFCG